MKRKLPPKFKIAVSSREDAMSVLKAFETFCTCLMIFTNSLQILR